MVDREQIHQLINHRLTRILDVAAVAIPPDRFKSYKKIVLDEFGKSGLATELDEAFSEKTDRQGTGRNILRKGRGAS